MRTKNKVFSICLLGAAFFATFFSAGALLGASAAEEEGGAEQQPAQTENFAATQEGWDALPAGWTFGEDVMTSTANVFLGGGAMRDYYADTPSDYTLTVPSAFRVAAIACSSVSVRDAVYVQICSFPPCVAMSLSPLAPASRRTLSVSLP